MTRKPRPAKRTRTTAAAAPEVEEQGVPTIVEHPDGFYVRSADGREEVGPFESFELAAAERDADTEEAVPEGDLLREAESEIGMSDWIDAETGEPAEGTGRPRLPEG